MLNITKYGEMPLMHSNWCFFSCLTLRICFAHCSDNFNIQVEHNIAEYILSIHGKMLPQILLICKTLVQEMLINKFFSISDVFSHDFLTLKSLLDLLVSLITLQHFVRSFVENFWWQNFKTHLIVWKSSHKSDKFNQT